jgi:SAM-dependent methyltransferase
MSTFDSYAGTYSDDVQSSIDFSGLQHEFFLKAKADVLADILRDHFGNNGPAQALDIGCGVGLLHPYIRPFFTRLVGIDISAASIAQARQANPNVDYYTAQDLPYPDGAFDVTMTVCVLHHVLPEHWASFARDMRRVTRPGGLICVIEHNPLNPMTQLAVHRCAFDADAILLRASKTKALLQGAGATRVKTEFFLTLPTRHIFARKLERLVARVPLGAQYLTSAVA